MHIRTVIIGMLVIAIIGIGSAFWLNRQAAVPSAAAPKSVGETPLTTVIYQCDGGKSITASYFQGTAMPSDAPGQPPMPTGRVVVKTSDGRSLALPQTISADGARYGNKDDSIVFWSKGSDLMFTENGTSTYMGCKALLEE